MLKAAERSRSIRGDLTSLPMAVLILLFIARRAVSVEKIAVGGMKRKIERVGGCVHPFVERLCVRVAMM